nr:MAG: capsid protein [Chemarfal virus 16]
MRRRAYIKVPRPAPVRIPKYTPTSKYYPSPVTQTQPMMKRSRRGRRTGVGLLAPVAGWALRRLYDRYRRKGYAVSRVQTAGNGSTNSYYKHTQKFHPKAGTIKKGGQAQHYHVVASFRMSNAVFGEQVVKTFDCALFSDLNNMANAIPTIGGTATLTKSALLHDIKTEYTFSNMSEATVFLDFYELMPRSILPAGACAPDVLFENGIVDEGVALGKEILGVKPTSSTALTSFYKIMKCTRVELAQGQSHCHKQSYNLGFKWNYQLINVLGSSYYHPRCSRMLMVIAQGAPCNGTGAENVKVTTTPIAVDVVIRNRYTWYYNVPATTNIRYESALPTLTTSARIMDIGSGEAETVDVA